MLQGHGLQRRGRRCPQCQWPVNTTPALRTMRETYPLLSGCTWRRREQITEDIIVLGIFPESHYMLHMPVAVQRNVLLAQVAVSTALSPDVLALVLIQSASRQGPMQYGLYIGIRIEFQDIQKGLAFHHCA